MKKKKYEKSELTSKERKALRSGEPAPEPVPSAEETVTKKKSTRITAIVLITVFVIAIFLGIFIPSYMSAHYMYEDNPVAVITMSTDDETYTLKYELFAEECPRGVANFSYLASIGYFDGTVVYDTQNKRVRFGGYTKGEDDKGNTVYSHRAYDEEFTTKHLDDFNLVAEPDRVTETDHSKLFRYALREDSTTLKETDILFSLNAYKYNCLQSATNFQIFADPDLVPNNNGNDSLPGSGGDRFIPDDRISQGSSSRTFYSYPIGRPLKDDEATGKAVNAILALGRVTTPVNTYYEPPAKTVTIDSVKIYNYDEYNKWNRSEYEHGFESYMTKNFADNIFYNWTRYTYGTNK